MRRGIWAHSPGLHHLFWPDGWMHLNNQAADQALLHGAFEPRVEQNDSDDGAIDFACKPNVTVEDSQATT